ncbi:MAG: hypothetical protein MZV49_24925 [Rhodopseudomonas palustris]|nr:hypothetical protein [Rhodopseudomonas palustris]
MQKLADYRLHLAPAGTIWRATRPIGHARGSRGAPRCVGYIPDMIFDKELDYLTGTRRAGGAGFASNSVSVQLNWLRAGRRGRGSCMTSPCPQRPNW